MIFNGNFEKSKIFLREAQLGIVFKIKKIFLRVRAQLDGGHKKIEYGKYKISKKIF